MGAKASNDKKRRTVISYAGVAVILLAVALLYGLWDKSGGKTASETDQAAVSESDYYVQTVSDTDVNMDDVDIERVRVTELLQIVESDGDWGGESMVQRTQLFTVDILTGPYKGESAVMTLDLTDITGTGKVVIEAKVGDRLLGYFVTDESTGALVGTCTGFQRDVPLLRLGIGFILLMLLFFGREGFKSFAALAVTCVMLIFVMIPLVYHGMDPILAVAIFGFATIVVTLLMVYGPSISSLSAGCGARGGVLTAALIAYGMKNVIWITGTVEEDSISLLYTDNGSKLDVSAIMFAAIVIGSLGGTIDVSVSIASSLEELKDKMGESITGWELARSGMTVGRSIMGASLNTMILAYVGSSFQLLMLFSAYHMNMIDIINHEMIAVELLRSLAGCFGLLMTVPITSVVAAVVSSGGSMGTFHSAAAETFLGWKERMGHFWRRSVEEAGQQRGEEKEEAAPVNLFERAKEHYRDTGLDSSGVDEYEGLAQAHPTRSAEDMSDDGSAERPRKHSRRSAFDDGFTDDFDD
ncbi:MAG: YibE/F family protein [Clostridia bacterium]|nr:YibE/F family protein [Clostridia bacterium]